MRSKLKPSRRGRERSKMVTKRYLLEYCDSLSEELAELEGTVYKLKVEMANLHEKKHINPVKKTTKK